MERNKLILFFTILFCAISFSSCDDDDNWINSYLNCELPSTTNSNGYFENIPRDYFLTDLENIYYGDDIQEIRLIDAWVDIYGDFFKGDIIEGLEIYVQNVGTYVFPADYIIGNSSGIRIDESNAHGYFQFMSRVMRELERNGRIRVVASGYHNGRFSNINVVLKNTLDVRIW